MVSGFGGTGLRDYEGAHGLIIWRLNDADSVSEKLLCAIKIFDQQQISGSRFGFS